MKSFLLFVSSNNLIHRLLYVIIPISLNYSCEKENNSEIGFKFHAIEIVYYPEKQISITFIIIPEGDNSPFILKWYEPDSLKKEGPYTIDISSDYILDFEVRDAHNISKRFKYEIKIDTIDYVKYDYRNQYIGKYSCNVTYTYADAINYFLDTITVVKNNSFNNINILTRNDIINNWEGNQMTYLNTHGYYSYPEGDFYGYHSGVSFKNDSIYYTASGPLGFYYTNVYKGIRINQ
jgi:hypothetical protein